MKIICKLHYKMKRLFLEVSANINKKGRVKKALSHPLRKLLLRNLLLRRVIMNYRREFYYIQYINYVFAKDVSAIVNGVKGSVFHRFDNTSDIFGNVELCGVALNYSASMKYRR